MAEVVFLLCGWNIIKCRQIIVTPSAVASWTSRVSAPADLQQYYSGFMMALPPPQATKGKRKGVPRSRDEEKKPTNRKHPAAKGAH